MKRGRKGSMLKAVGMMLSTFMLLLLFSACSNSTSDSTTAGEDENNSGERNNSQETQEPIAGITEEVIRIADIDALSGPASYVGKASTAGFHDYMSIVNEAGGIKGRQIEILDIDHAGDPGKAVAAFNQAINSGDVFTVWVGTSPAAVAVADLVEREKMPTMVISPTTTIYDPPKKYLFTIGSPYSVEAARAVDFLVEELAGGEEALKVAWIGMDEASGQTMYEGAKAALEAYGHQFLTEQFIQRGGTDVASQLQNIKNSGAEYVLMGTLTKEGSAILKEAEKIALDNVTFIGTSFITTDVEMFKLAGEHYLDNFYGVWPANFWDDNDPLIEEVIKAAENNGNGEFVEIKSPYYLYGALTAYVMAEALENAPELTHEGLVEGYEKLNNYSLDGFVETITYSPEQRIPMTKVRVVKVIKMDERYTLEQVSDFKEPVHIDKLGLPWIN